MLIHHPFIIDSHHSKVNKSLITVADGIILQQISVSSLAIERNVLPHPTSVGLGHVNCFSQWNVAEVTF